MSVGCLPNIFTLKHVDSLNLEEQDSLDEYRHSIICNWKELRNYGNQTFW